MQPRPNESPERLPVRFKTDSAGKVFESLVDFFIEDYMARKYVAEKSGWRSLSEIAQKARVSQSLLYGRHGTMGPALDEPLRRGFIESRIFPGERGRGGEVLRLRIAYEKEPIREYVNRIAMVGRGPVAMQKTVSAELPAPFEAKMESPGLAQVPSERASAPLDKSRIAILPFSNISPDPDDEYFADGLTED